MSLLRPIHAITRWYERKYTDPFTVICVKSATQAEVRSIKTGKLVWDPILINDAHFLTYGHKTAERLERLWMQDYPEGRAKIFPGHLHF